MPRRVIFISTMDHVPWGGSEELWSRTALELVDRGVPVSASVPAWSPPHPRVVKLQERGVDLWLRSSQRSLSQRAWHRLTHQSWELADIRRLLNSKPPAFVVLSGSYLPPLNLLELCMATRVPFVTIEQSNSVSWWPPDEVAERYRTLLNGAARCYFVSEANRQLTEKQLGTCLSNAEIVRNPFNVDFYSVLDWPAMTSDGEVRLACVGRLSPIDKGQDLLFEALAHPCWARRCWRLYLYGEGPMRDGLQRLAQSLGIADRVVFSGHRTVEEIWALNHVLVMPSRYEGLPLAMVEAMLCARPVIATNVAGHSEIVEDGVTGFLADAPTVSSVALALERFWARRGDAEAIGKAGAQRIRHLVPPDPARIFADKLMGLVDLAWRAVPARSGLLPA